MFIEPLPGNPLIKSVTIPRTMKWVKYVEYKRLIRNTYTILIRNLEEVLWTPGHMWEDNIKMGLKESRV
jgi:hypothetical protein